MQTYQERNYAPRKRKLEKSDLEKYSNRSEKRQTSETSGGDCLQCCQESQKEIETAICAYGKEVLLIDEVVFVGEKDGKFVDSSISESSPGKKQKTVNTRNQRSRKHGDDSKMLVDMQTIPAKRTYRKRKAVGDKKPC